MAVPALARLLAARLCADGLARPDIYHGLRGLAAAHLGVLDPKYNPVPERALLELATISNPDDALRAADPAVAAADGRPSSRTALIAAHHAVQ